jgi:LuxR family maltose regulon positive regulatory protein
MPDGAEHALADAKFALERFAPGSDWRPSALLIRGVAHALLGVAGLARADLAAAVETGLESGATDDTFNAQAQLALLAAHQDAWGEAGRWAGQAKALVEETRLDHYAASALVHVAVARVALHEGRQSDARAALTRAHRLRPLLGHGLPWLAIQVGLELTRAHLALGEAAAARTVLTESERVLQRRPDLGSLAAEARELREHVRATSSPAGSPAMSLTAAELRLLPYLATHLTYPEIGQRLFISRHTVKAEATSLFRKLSASSRSEAINRAVEIGLLETVTYPPRAIFT